MYGGCSWERPGIDEVSTLAKPVSFGKRFDFVDDSQELQVPDDRPDDNECDDQCDDHGDSSDRCEGWGYGDFPSYASRQDQPLLGVPIREGSLWFISSQDYAEPVTFHLYVNGFSFCMPNGLESSVSLSPFSTVRLCRFTSGECTKLKSFKVTPFEDEPSIYFGARAVKEHEAEEMRSGWVLDISHMILLVTDSLLPHVRHTCQPSRGLPCTEFRLLAGYLMYRDEDRSLLVLFCELQAHQRGFAHLVLYENDRCDRTFKDILLSKDSCCGETTGINCSCFAVDRHQFAVTSPSERKLWLRALNNVKVKIQSGAPEPDAQDLVIFRNAIQEHVTAFEAIQAPRISGNALLARAMKMERNGADDLGEGASDRVRASDRVLASLLL